MPKIGIERVTIGGDLLTLQIYYSRETGFFYKGLPDEFMTVSEFINMASAEEDLKIGLNAAMRKYYELKKTERVSIMYKCSATAELRMNKIAQGYAGTRKGVSEKIQDMRGYGYGFTIEFNKVKIVDNGKDAKYYIMNGDEMESYSRNRIHFSDWCEIPFTEERMAFFEKIAESMKKLIEQLSFFFDMDQEKAMMFIEKNSPPLLEVRHQ